MKSFKRCHKVLLACLLPASLALSGCADDDDAVAMSSYTIKVTNITNAQPLTPVAVVMHKTGYSPWGIGVASSEGLEKLAEGGDTTDFVAEAIASTNVVATGTAGTAPFAEGNSVSIDMEIVTDSSTLLTIATMLANTNDAFAGSQQVKIGALAVGDSMTVFSDVHDAGTEKNTEALGTMPGPADTTAGGGEGFNVTRDDIHNFVTIHPGVVTMDDGLSTSVLGEENRWLAQAARVDITRTK